MAWRLARPVETGISDQERIEILAGLDADDTVIVGPFRSLDEMVEGQPVELEETDRKKEDPRRKTARRPSRRQRPGTTAREGVCRDGSGSGGIGRDECGEGIMTAGEPLIRLRGSPKSTRWVRSWCALCAASI